MWYVNRIKKIWALQFLLATLFLVACNTEEPPTLGTLIVNDVTSDVIQCCVAVSDATPDDYGFYYATSKSEAEKATANKVKGTYNSNYINGSIERLTPNTVYYIRAYAMNVSGRVYTKTIEVRTLPRTPQSNDNKYPDIYF